MKTTETKHLVHTFLPAAFKILCMNLKALRKVLCTERKWGLGAKILSFLRACAPRDKAEVRNVTIRSKTQFCKLGE